MSLRSGIDNTSSTSRMNVKIAKGFKVGNKVLNRGFFVSCPRKVFARFESLLKIVAHFSETLTNPMGCIFLFWCLWIIENSTIGFIPEQQGCLIRSEEHTSELQSRENLVCRLLLEKKKLTSTRAWA